jgi:hypothetical protein
MDESDRQPGDADFSVARRMRDGRGATVPVSSRSRALANFAMASIVAAFMPGLAQAAPTTISLVLGSWHFALYETPNAKEECPDGFQFKQADNYKAQFPTPEERRAREEKFGYYVNRGPQGENVFYFPTVVKDPLPFRAVQTKTALGLNLDGESEGKGGGVSAPHENFTSPDGEPGIDNQLYRVLGCVPGWRKGGMIEGVIQEYVHSEYQARFLLDISGIEDERNSPHVTVTTYRGLDAVAEDPSGKLIPWLSQRIDYKRAKRYIQTLQGKIVDGVLTTDPADVRLPAYEQPDMAQDRIIRQMRLRLELSPTGAQGLLGGYVDIESWYLMYAKNWGAHTVADTEGWSGPATYQALHEFADYRDPTTGTLTGISAAYAVDFARVYIVNAPRVAEVPGRRGAMPTAAAR